MDENKNLAREEEKKKHRVRRIIIVVVVLAFIVMLVPIPLKCKDGGTVQYDALLYDVFDYNRIGTDYYRNRETGEMKCSVLKGTEIYIFGLQVYDGTWDDHPEGNGWEQISYEEFEQRLMERRLEELNKADGN